MLYTIPGCQATAISMLMGSVSARQAVHLLHIENYILSAWENAPSAGESKKETALISQDCFGLVVATGLEPVTPSM